MGQRGPQPKPTMLKVLDGNPGKRRIPDEPKPTTPLAVPAVIKKTKGAEREWKRVVASMPDGFFADADAPVLTTYCLSWCLYNKAIETIEAEGMFAKGSTGQEVLHPAVTAVQKQAEQIIKTSDRLGMSPAARSRLEVQAVDPGGRSPSSEAEEEDDLLRG